MSIYVLHSTYATVFNSNFKYTQMKLISLHHMCVQQNDIVILYSHHNSFYIEYMPIYYIYILKRVRVRLTFIIYTQNHSSCTTPSYKKKKRNNNIYIYSTQQHRYVADSFSIENLVLPYRCS